MKYTRMLEHAYSYGQHLERLGVATMAIIVALLGTGVAVSASSLADQTYQEFFLLAAIVLLVAFAPCLLMTTATSFVAANPKAPKKKRDFEEYCLHHSTDWNRIRTMMLALSWVSLFFALLLLFFAVVLGAAPHPGNDTPPLVIVGRIVAGASYITLICAMCYVGYRLSDRRAKKHKKYLRKGYIIGLGAGPPKECCSSTT